MKRLVLLIIFIFIAIQMTFAGQFSLNNYGQQYIKDDFNIAKSEWIVHDIDSDGKGEYFYFDSNGFMLKNTTTPDGYQVDNEGRWVIDGVIQKTDTINTQNIIAENKIIDNTQAIDISQTNILNGNEDKFVDNGDNTESINNDPNSIPPKVKKAMEWIDFLTNESGKYGIHKRPWSKRMLKTTLALLGYKQDVRNRAVSEFKSDWNEYALMQAQIYYTKTRSYETIKKQLEYEGYTASEINYAISNIENETERKFINPNEYEGLTDEEKTQKLYSLGYSDKEQIKYILEFINTSLER